MTYKKIIFLILTLALAAPIWAQVDETIGSSQLDWAVENIVLIMGVAAIIGATFALYKSTKTIWKAQNISAFEADGMSHTAAVKKANQQSFWGYIYQQLDGGVDLEHEEDVLLNHDYDGIQELDNNLPPWWVGMFYVTILFAGIYMVVYHVTDIGKSNIEAYEQEVKDAEIAIAAFMAKQAKEKAESITAETVTILTDTDRLAAGQDKFKTYCAACHGQLGEGLENLGQNLTDDYWIHGGGVKNIFKTISEGVVGKPMIAWKETLNPSEIQELSSYILTLKGTNPPNARPPEGEIWNE